MMQPQPSTSNTPSQVIKATNYRSIVCATCLTGNRKLFSVSGLQHLTNICSGIYLAYEDKICWECKASLSKMWEFQQKAIKSYSILTHLAQKYETCSDQDIFVQSLSTLQLTNTIKEEYLDDEPVKKEKTKVTRGRGRPATKKRNVKVKMEYQNSSDDEDDSQTQIHSIVKSELAGTATDSSDSDSMSDETAEIYFSKTIMDKNIFTRTLSEEEMLSAREKDKEYRQYMKSEHKCELCIRYFRTPSKYKKHLLLHAETEGKYKCHICELRFMIQAALTRHVSAHYRYYECGDCGYKNQNLKHVTNHWTRKHSARIRRCDECPAKFTTHRALKYHVETEHREKPKCDQCGKLFRTNDYLRKHMVLHKDIEFVACNICQKRFRDDAAVRIHMRCHDDSGREDSFCAECNIQFKNVHRYRAHLNSLRHIPPDELKFECAECGKKFVFKTGMKRHIETMHSKEPNYPCTNCHKAFYSARSLKEHDRKKHRGINPRRHIVCEICGKSYSCKETLKQHMNSHLGVRPYKCELCEATFNYSGALYTHRKLVHLGLKRTDKLPDVRTRLNSGNEIVSVGEYVLKTQRQNVARNALAGNTLAGNTLVGNALVGNALAGNNIGDAMKPARQPETMYKLPDVMFRTPEPPFRPPETMFRPNDSMFRVQMDAMFRPPDTMFKPPETSMFKP